MRTLSGTSAFACLLLAPVQLLGCGESEGTAGPHDYGTSQDAALDAHLPDVVSDAISDAVQDQTQPPDAQSDGSSDSGVDAALPEGPALYPSDRTHSPITPWVVARLGEVLAADPGSRRDVFMKVGDSITASSSFLDCFASGNVDLGSHQALQPTLDLYLGASVQGTTPFDRESLCMESGRTAWWAMTGQPSPLAQELGALDPSVAVVMFGTNDIGWYGSDHVATLKWYHDYLFDLVDALLAAGVIPILSTIPPRDDDASLDAWVPTFNAAIRGMAQGRQIPLLDFHRELMTLAGHGLASDGVHPNTHPTGACTLTDEGLGYGYNLRNLLTLTALDRVRLAALAGEGAQDAVAPMLQGNGTAASPFVVTGNPFTDVRDTTSSSSRNLNVYGGCSSTADESGPEYVYRLDVTAPVRVRAVVLDRGEVDADIHLLDATGSEAGCVQRGDTIVEAELAPGTWHLVVDTYVNGGVEKGGEFLLTVLTCAPGDAACE